MLNVVFMGTPEFAAVSLEALYDAGYNIQAVFSQPDKPKGRGMTLTPTPVKCVAEKHKTPVYQPVKLRDGTALSILKELSPDVIVVVAYGRILPDDILAVPPFGCINVHASLLPKYRGASPIQWSVLNGDKFTGVTTMYLASEMDSGDLIFTEKTEIGEFETSGELSERLSEIGAKLIVKTLSAIEDGSAPRIQQVHSEATYVGLLDKTLSPIDFNKKPRDIVKKIYGLQPWPVATMPLNGDTVKVFAAEYSDDRTDQVPGSILSADSKGIKISCGDGETILITEIQLPGKKRLKISEFIKGHKVIVNA